MVNCVSCLSGLPLPVPVRGQLSATRVPRRAYARALTSWILSDRLLNMAFSSHPLPGAPASQAVRSEFPQEASVARGDYGINCRGSTVSCLLSEKQTETYLSFSANQLLSQRQCLPPRSANRFVRIVHMSVFTVP